MKILYIANLRLPTERAHGIQLAKMCEAYANLGHDVRLIAPRRIASTTNNFKEFYGLKKNIPITLLPIVDVYKFGRYGFLMSSFSFMVSSAIYVCLKRLTGFNGLIYTIDLDHFSFIPLSFLAKKYVVEVHGPKKRSPLHKFFFQKASGVFCVTTQLCKFIIDEFNTNESKVYCAPNGVSIEQFNNDLTHKKAKQTIGYPAGKKVAIYVGRIYGWKNMGILADVGQILGDKYLIVIVGGTYAEFRKVTNRTLVPSNVFFAGSRQFSEIALWLKSSDCLLVLGTLKNEDSMMYTSPMKLFEYMAVSRPIVASSTPAIRDIIDDSHAFFYTPDDKHSLAQAIKKAVTHEKLAIKKVKKARSFVNNMTWENRAKMILSKI